MSRYLVAIKLGQESSGITADQVAEVPGVSIVGDPRPRSVLVEADQKAIQEVQQRFGEYLLVEAQSIYSRS